MTGRSCGVTIADKAIVCFRCGTPTAAPAPPRNISRTRRWRGIEVVLGLAAVVVWLEAPGPATGAVRVAAAVGAVAAITVALVRALRGRG